MSKDQPPKRRQSVTDSGATPPIKMESLDLEIRRDASTTARASVTLSGAGQAGTSSSSVPPPPGLRLLRSPSVRRKVKKTPPSGRRKVKKTPARRARRKPVTGTGSSTDSSFLVTVDHLQMYDEIRQDFLALFAGQQLEEYCVAVKRHGAGLDAQLLYLIYAYLKFERKLMPTEVKTVLSARYAGHGIHCRAWESSGHTLIGITREDVVPLFNVSVSRLNFVVQIRRWAESVPADGIQLCDPFVLAHRNTIGYLKEYLAAYRTSCQEPFAGYRTGEGSYAGWPLFCQIWHDDMVRALTAEATRGGTKWRKKSHIHKLRQLYLWGPSGVGKSTYVQGMIGSQNDKYVFQPDAGKFAYQFIRPNFHQYVVFEEFNMERHLNGTLRRLLEGRSFVASVKRKDGIRDTCRLPVILMSNSPPPQDENFLSRVLVVHAEVPYWTLEMTTVPKKEAVKEERQEVIQISSSSEQD